MSYENHVVAYTYVLNQIVSSVLPSNTSGVLLFIISLQQVLFFNI